MTIRTIAATLAPLAATLVLAGCTTPAADTLPPPIQTAAPASIGTVSAADPRAEEAGMAMLRAGGNATDAAIATMLALTVVEPQSSGIGGGGFLVRGTADGTVESFDGRETAPAGATPDWFLNADGTLPTHQQSVRSGLSVGVPGNLALAKKVHDLHGKLPWAQLFEPAIALAQDGFRINPRLYDYLVKMPEHVGHSPEGRALFYDAAGTAFPVGHLVTNPELAVTLRRNAQGGPEVFYRGPHAEILANTVAAATPHGGAMTATDLAGDDAKQRDPVCGQYRGYRICGMGPPSSGGIAVLQILGQLERFDLRALGAQNPETWHLFIESQRLAYADRELYAADSDFVSVPVRGLIDPSYIARRSALIDPGTTMALVRPGTPVGAPQALADGDEPVERGTSHFVAVDGDNTMISFTSTIEGPFGSGLMVGGFYLNNELTDFSRAPMVDGVPVANRVEAGKRPRSSMAPMVVWDPQGQPILAIGAAGGATIPVQTARAIIGVIDFDLSAEAALGLPFIMAYGDTLMVEQGTWLEGAIPAFVALGHDQVSARNAPVKGNAAKREGGIWVPARDPRLAEGLALP